MSYLPPSARAFRDAICSTIPGFKYGQPADRLFLNGTTVGRTTAQKAVCICDSAHWKPFVVPIHNGPPCVVTTDTRCLRNANAAAVLSLQAGFRFEYVPPLSRGDIDDDVERTFADDVESALEEHMFSLCAEFRVDPRDVQDWFVHVMAEVDRSLARASSGPDYLPLTGHIDFADARRAFRKLHDQVVISRVDKAANCLCIMCRACYIRIATAEVRGPGYTPFLLVPLKLAAMLS